MTVTSPAQQEDCGVIDIGCRVSDVIGGAAGDAIQAMADAVTEALGKALASLGTLWVNVDTPNLTTSGGRPSAAVAFIQDSLWFYMAGAAVLAVVVGGARMAWERRGEPGRDLVKSLLTLTVVSGAGLTGIALAIVAADGFAQWIIARSTDGTSFGENIAGLVALSSRAGLAVGPLLVIILGLCAVVASLVQIMLMVARGGMLVILAGVLPLAASFTSTEMGRAWFKKALGWTLAFILYKPAAAVVYATAFRLAGSDVFGDDGSGLMDVLVGLVLMVLALFALPALMRFVTPVVSQLASGGGGGGLGAAALAAAPSGAMALGRGGSSSGGGTRPVPAQPTAGSGGGGGSGPGGSATAGAPSGPGAAGQGRANRSSAATGATGTGGTTPTGTASTRPASGAGGSSGGGAAGGAAGGGAAATGTGGGAAPAGSAGVAGAAAAGARAAGSAGAAAARRAVEDSSEGEAPRGSS